MTHRTIVTVNIETNQPLTPNRLSDMIRALAMTADHYASKANLVRSPIATARTETHLEVEA